MKKSSSHKHIITGGQKSAIAVILTLSLACGMVGCTPELIKIETNDGRLLQIYRVDERADGLYDVTVMYLDNTYKLFKAKRLRNRFKEVEDNLPQTPSSIEDIVQDGKLEERVEKIEDVVFTEEKYDEYTVTFDQYKVMNFKGEPTVTTQDDGRILITGVDSLDKRKTIYVAAGATFTVNFNKEITISVQKDKD